MARTAGRETPSSSPSAESVAAGRLGHTLKRAEQALISRKTSVLQEFGLTVPQYAALLLLAASDGMSAAQLARECMVTPQTMATVLGNLERDGRIVRQPSPLHQKVVVNRATAKGRAVLKKADAAALRVESSLAAAFSEDELSRFEEFLERAITTLGDYP